MKFKKVENKGGAAEAFFMFLLLKGSGNHFIKK